MQSYNSQSQNKMIQNFTEVSKIPPQKFTVAYSEPTFQSIPKILYWDIHGENIPAVHSRV